MKYLKAQKDGMPIKDEDIIQLEDFIETTFSHWNLKKVLDVPMVAIHPDSPDQRFYKINDTFRILSGRYLEITIGYIAYDGVYESEDNPNEEIARFCSRLEKFGYKVRNVVNDWCDVTYSRKYVSPERHTDLKPELTYKKFEVRR